ncbi:D-alanyl-D-alanine carboxypeptidase/D-alanyl-D-alanine-endopeptidase (penicillin-binding protein 4) [Balneicella halophila]|uniref:D-alanyl-D-alanine carboxypeptidase/D-alanyl-D-alanine-endopeptidase (Penicillin-binding protein 4) n=1 Tax=Balneicella halophila TaxID=1537566 RepID=A0A7L4UTA3_BALHA|nr:D-alanyl-D-alanine carboxypeptidase/D-alanyl-D-alanine-endopeptidase [Balneicella halophila]PVX52567.1 D-alanyl-D-alanine carboxypeptidase/D-alanyl-D-alanine-endopeptidase (penicillin-binding protein 4) [Balneicella halophila]
MRRSKLLIFLLLNAVVATFGQGAQTIHRSINEFVTDEDLKHASLGIHVISSNGEELGAYNAEKSLATASILKLLSTATVLEQKGADFRYETPVSYTGKLQNGLLNGSIVITGVGDPTFNSKYFKDKNAVNEIVYLLKSKGIKLISGDIFIDESAFDARVPSTWTWEDLGNYYGATVHPINYNDNLYKLTFTTAKAGSLAKITSVKPDLGLAIRSEVLASKIKADKAYIFGAPFSKERIVRGTLPEYRKIFTVKGSLPNPALAFGQALKKTLISSGIPVKGMVKITPCTETKIELGVISSPALRDIIKQTNHKSINLYAEALLYLVEGSKSTAREDLLKSLKNYWEGKGLGVDGLYLHDGSGLSHFNAANPSFFTALLRYMSESSQTGAFKKSLPLSGLNGTLKYLGKNTDLVGKAHAKSGSMQQVCCYAGYLKTQSGEEVAFAVMVNNYRGSTSKLRNKIAQLLMKW